MRNMKEHEVQYNIISGGRSSGKSYAIKSEVLKAAHARGEEVVCLRRRGRCELGVEYEKTRVL